MEDVTDEQYERKKSRPTRLKNSKILQHFGNRGWRQEKHVYHGTSNMKRRQSYPGLCFLRTRTALAPALNPCPNAPSLGFSNRCDGLFRPRLCSQAITSPQHGAGRSVPAAMVKGRQRAPPALHIPSCLITELP